MADYQDPLVIHPSDGVVRGDSKAMPNRGTSSGFTGIGDDTHGADVSQGANNTLGSAHLPSDGIDATSPPGGGDFVGTNPHSSSPGVGMGSAADSDSMYEDVPGDR